jgi:hypothetical protein
LTQRAGTTEWRTEQINNGPAKPESTESRLPDRAETFRVHGATSDTTEARAGRAAGDTQK